MGYSQQTVSDVAKLIRLKVVRIASRYDYILDDFIVADVLQGLVPSGFDWFVGRLGDCVGVPAYSV